MTLSVDSTPLSPTCNSYVGSAEMETYVAERVTDATAKATWLALTSALKAAYLVNATRAIDTVADFIGYQYSRDQKLKWPRYDAWVEGYLLDVTTFPHQVRDATAEMALWIASNGGAMFVQQAGAAFDAIKVGPINIDFNEYGNGPQFKYFPDIVAYLLRDIADVTNPPIPGSAMVKTVRLIRA